MTGLITVTMPALAHNHKLLINATKTKALTFTNARDNPPSPVLSINNTSIDNVSDYKYLGTTLTSKLKLDLNTELITCKTRKKLFIMSKLRYMGTSDQLTLNCYRTFIESSLLFHSTAIYHHMSEKNKSDL